MDDDEATRLRAGASPADPNTAGSSPVAPTAAASVHVAHIKDKLRAEKRFEIALRGIRLGLVEPSPDDAGSVAPG